jgi:hypothetical protein
MAQQLKDFLVKNPLYGIPGYDLNRLEALPPKEFRRMYVANMKTYFEDPPRGVIECWECSEDITSPEELVRRFGASLHNECFKIVHARERDTDQPYDRRYFDLVLDSLDEA